jgi:transposase
MSRDYWLDLREHVAAMRGGLGSYEAAEHYQVNQSSAQHWFNGAQAQGSP